MHARSARVRVGSEGGRGAPSSERGGFMSTASVQRWERRGFAAFLAAAALATVAGPATDASADVATPTVTGPITGGLHGRPFTSATFDLAAFGYVEEEY